MDKIASVAVRRLLTRAANVSEGAVRSSLPAALRPMESTIGKAYKEIGEAIPGKNLDALLESAGTKNSTLYNQLRGRSLPSMDALRQLMAEDARLLRNAKSMRNTVQP